MRHQHGTLAQSQQWKMAAMTLTIETEDVVGRLGVARDTLAGHLFGHEANAVSAGIDLIQSLSERIAVLEGVLEASQTGAINVASLNRVTALRKLLIDVSLAAGNLIVAADGIEKLRPQREAALHAIDAARASLTQGGNAG